MSTAILMCALFFAKVVDNALSTTKTILFVQLFGSVSRPIKRYHKHLLLLICRQKRFLLHFSKNLFVYKKFTIRGIKNGQTSRENLEKSAQNAL